MTEGTFLTPVAGGRASQQIVDQIVGLLRSGRLEAGDRLPSERQLAEAFGVSRVTVRDAIRVLQARGLMEVKVGVSGGAFVTAPSADVLGERLSDVLTMSTITPEEVAEARLVMELGILDLALDRATEEDLAALRSICQRAEAVVADGRYDPQLANDFHARLAAASQNWAVTQVAESFRGPLRMAALRSREPADDAHHRTVEDHRAVLEALEQGNRADARAAMVRHLTRGTSLKPPES
ncbi:MAG: GntR family transcriptional regulator [Propionibacteriales bacterium]|nr:GntR family transcriptional regulator [Propionibacteriales bacterium]